MANKNNGFCIYITTLLQGPVPVERDGDGKPIVYQFREAAERVIAECVRERIDQYLAGQRAFDDAMTIEEYTVPVTVFSDGFVTDQAGNVFPREGW